MRRRIKDKTVFRNVSKLFLFRFSSSLPAGPFPLSLQKPQGGKWGFLLETLPPLQSSSIPGILPMATSTLRSSSIPDAYCILSLHLIPTSQSCIRNGWGPTPPTGFLCGARIRHFYFEHSTYLCVFLSWKGAALGWIKASLFREWMACLLIEDFVARGSESRNVLLSNGYTRKAFSPIEEKV